MDNKTDTRSKAFYRHRYLAGSLLFLCIVLTSIGQAQTQNSSSATGDVSDRNSEKATENIDRVQKDSTQKGPQQKDTSEEIDTSTSQAANRSRFEPTEEVSEDLSISFPADI